MEKLEKFEQRLNTTVSFAENAAIITAIGGGVYLFFHPEQLIEFIEWLTKLILDILWKLGKQAAKDAAAATGSLAVATANAIEPATANIAAKKPSSPGGLWLPSFGSFGAR